MNNNPGLGLEELPKELKLILELLKENSLITKGMFEGIDWDLFIRLAIHHRVYSTLFFKVKINELVPQQVVNRFAFEYKKNTFKMLYLSGEMEQVSKLFDQNNLKLIHLKGPILAKELYGDVSLRTSSDLDVLVPISDLSKIDDLLIELGYEKDELVSVLNDWKWRHHHIAYFHPKKQIKLEVHWRLNPGPAKEPSFEELWKRKRTSLTTSNPVYYLGPEDLFLFLVSHGARHGWSRLRWLLDIHQILKQSLNWNKINHLMKKYQFMQVADQSLLLCSRLFGTPLNGELKHRIQSKRSWELARLSVFYYERMVNLHSEPLPLDVANYHKRYLYSIKSFQHKLLFNLSFLYPYPMDMKLLKLPKYLHFLYFPLRPILWAFRKSMTD
ncbi:nucleotidyltransferase domain-containing protein [Metabacillus elymi]|uniref:Nucleotidyltransferase family protein n=1 Tax=Metabacillus elymi TaxID=2745198 RepID=A0ABX6RXV1_9BACI|nr:nucleotidyltransferase family protein [Metabacillus sp. KUDC1714]QNF26178.1 nucleotidyltransferase family protein [Metabacillus sp. KUDC1714]